MIELLPGTMTTADMLADNPGTWMIHCHVADHIAAGMLKTYKIGESAGAPTESGGGHPHPAAAAPVGR